MNLKLVIIGEKGKDINSILVKHDNTRIILRTNNKFIADITDTILPSFRTNFTKEGIWSNFELTTGEEFKHIQTTFEYED